MTDQRWLWELQTCANIRQLYKFHRRRTLMKISSEHCSNCLEKEKHWENFLTRMVASTWLLYDLAIETIATNDCLFESDKYSSKKLCPRNTWQRFLLYERSTSLRASSRRWGLCLTSKSSDWDCPCCQLAIKAITK